MDEQIWWKQIAEMWPLILVIAIGIAGAVVGGPKGLAGAHRLRPKKDSGYER